MGIEMLLQRNSLIRYWLMTTTSATSTRPFDPPANVSNAVLTPAGRSSPDDTMISAERLAVKVRSWWAERGIELWSLRSGAKPALQFSLPQHPKDQVRIEISVGYAFDR